MEHWESLCPDGYRFVYADGLFFPSTDTFLLSAYPKLKANLRVCDLCAGTGLLGLLLLQRQPKLSVTGVELQPEAADLLSRCAAENQLTDRLSVQVGDVRDIRSLLPAGQFDLVVCNPPYYPPNSGYLAAAPSRRTARAEVGCTLNDVCAAAGYLLRWGGSFCLVHKPERLTDVLLSLRQHGLEPKRLRFVCKRPDAAPSLLLCDSRRGGKPGLVIEPPLILQSEDGSPTPELDAIYFRTLSNQEVTP